MVLTLGWGGGFVWVCGVSLFDFFSFPSGLLFSAGFFCLFKYTTGMTHIRFMTPYVNSINNRI